MTHKSSFLSECDIVVVMANGQIMDVGSYNELIDNDGAFIRLLHTNESARANEIEKESPGNLFNLV